MEASHVSTLRRMITTFMSRVSVECAEVEVYDSIFQCIHVVYDVYNPVEVKSGQKVGF